MWILFFVYINVLHGAATTATLTFHSKAACAQAAEFISREGRASSVICFEDPMPDQGGTK